MKEYSSDEMKTIYSNRCKKLGAYLTENNIGAAVFVDTEAHRDPSIPYYTGFSSDCVLAIFQDGFSILVPWDEILAKKNAFCNKIIPLTKYKCNNTSATLAILNMGISHSQSSKIDFPPYLTYHEYLEFIDTLENYDCRCDKKNTFKLYSSSIDYWEKRKKQNDEKMKEIENYENFRKFGEIQDRPNISKNSKTS